MEAVRHHQLSRDKFMLRMIARVVFAASLLAPAISNAGWSGSQQIQELYIHSSVIVLKLASNPNDGCADNAYLTLEPGSDPLFKERYSMLLAAMASSRPVDVFVSGCGTVQPTHPKVLYVRMSEL